MCYSLYVLDVAFWDSFVLQFICMCTVLLLWYRFSFFSTMPRDWLGRTSPKWPTRLRVEWDVKVNSVNQSENAVKHFHDVTMCDRQNMSETALWSTTAHGRWTTWKIDIFTHGHRVGHQVLRPVHMAATELDRSELPVNWTGLVQFSRGCERALTTGLIRFQAGRRTRRPSLALVF